MKRCCGKKPNIQSTLGFNHKKDGADQLARPRSDDSLYDFPLCLYLQHFIVINFFLPHLSAFGQRLSASPQP